MSNKFLDKYPQLYKPQVGDVVIMSTPDNTYYYQKGDVGTIIHVKPSLDTRGATSYTVNFNTHININPRVKYGGIISDVYADQFSIIGYNSNE